MPTIAIQESFIAQAVGKFYNPDNVAGFQCVDLIEAYAMWIFGKPWQEALGYGNAKDLLYGPPAYYWHKTVNDPNRPDQLPSRGDVLVYGGTPEWGPNPFGHICIGLDIRRDGATVLQMDGGTQVAAFVGNLGWDNPFTGPLIGWLTPNFDDDPVLQPAPLSAMERINGPHVTNQRSAPKLDAPVIRQIQPGAREIWDGWVRGDIVVTDSGPTDIWYKDKDGYALAALFENGGIDGLPDLTPKPAETPGPNQRVTGEIGAIMRSLPDKNSPQLEVFMPDRILTFKGWVRGTDPYGDGRTRWFVGALTGGYVHESALTDPDPHDLPDLTPVVPVPAPPAYDFDLLFTELNGITVEKRPAHIGNVDVGNFPAAPVMHVKHWWGQPPIPFESPLGEWGREGTFKSPHWQIGPDRIAQIVGHHDRAYHAGPGGNGGFGTEIDPRVTEVGPDGKPTAVALKIRANVNALDAALRAKGYVLTDYLHKNVPGNSTTCSPIDLDWLNAPLQPVVTPPANPPAAPEIPTDHDQAVLDKFWEWLRDGYMNRKV